MSACKKYPGKKASIIQEWLINNTKDEVEVDEPESTEEVEKVQTDKLCVGDTVKVMNKNLAGVLMYIPPPPASVLVDVGGVSYMFFRDQLIKV